MEMGFPLANGLSAVGAARFVKDLSLSHYCDENPAGPASKLLEMDFVTTCKIEACRLSKLSLAQFFVILGCINQRNHMKTTLISLSVMLVLTGCASSPFGQKVKEPFSGSAYESNNRFFRATGKGESSADNIARGKADIEAKTILAGQVNTTMKQVADNYQGQTENDRAADVAMKFQSLAREVMNTDLADIRKVGEKKYYNQKENKYTVFIAYEIKKNAMFSFMKKQAKTDQTINERQQELIQKILDEELKKSEAEEK
jgi:hypothetical protein